MPRRLTPVPSCRPYPSAPAVVAALAVLLAGGCRQDDDRSVVVEFWAMGSEGEAVQQLVPDFERRTPGVHVRVQQIPWSAAHEKLLTAYVGESMPDVFQAGNTWIPELAALGAVEALDDRIKDSPSVQRADYFSGILDTNVIDGRTFGVPWYVDTRLLFYRSDLLAEAGEADVPPTWEAWRTAMVRVKSRGGPAQYAILLPLAEWQTPVILGLQAGAQLLKDDDQYGDFRSPAFRRAFDFYLDLFNADLAPRTGETQVANVYQDFAAGYFAFYVTGPWNLGEFARRLPAALDGRWSTAPMPSPDREYPGLSLAGGASVALCRTSPSQAAAWRWIEYLSEPAQQAAFYRLTGDLPARRSAWERAALVDDRLARAFWRQLQRVRATPKIPEWERIASKITQYTEAAVRGRMSADEALAALDADVDRILEKRRWLRRRQATSVPDAR